MNQSWIQKEFILNFAFVSQLCDLSWISTSTVLTLQWKSLAILLGDRERGGKRNIRNRKFCLSWAVGRCLLTEKKKIHIFFMFDHFGILWMDTEFIKKSTVFILCETAFSLKVKESLLKKNPNKQYHKIRTRPHISTHLKTVLVTFYLLTNIKLFSPSLCALVCHGYQLSTLMILDCLAWYFSLIYSIFSHLI